MNDYVRGYKRGKEDYVQGNIPDYTLEPSEDFQRGYNAGYDVAKNAQDMQQPVDSNTHF